MDLKLTDEEKIIQSTVARFVETELVPAELVFLKQKEPFPPLGDPPLRQLDPALKTTLTEKAKKSGIWYLNLPEQLGGAGLNRMARVIAYREFGKTAVPFELPEFPSFLPGGPLMKRIADEDRSISPALGGIHKTGKETEICTTYRKAPGGYCLNGSNIDVLRPDCDFFLIPACEENSRTVALFLVERNGQGVVVSDHAEMTADCDFARLSLTECTISEEQLVGIEENLRQLIAEDRLRLAARSLGMGDRCLSASLEHARNRVTFGQPLSSRQAIQWMLVDISIKLRVATWLTLEAAWKADEGLPYYDGAASAKWAAARMAFEAADVAIQVHGGYGVCKEFPFESFYREARLMRLLYGREVEIEKAIAVTNVTAQRA